MKDALKSKTSKSKTQNADIMEALLDAYENANVMDVEEKHTVPDTTGETNQSQCQIHTAATMDDDMFVCTYSALKSLLDFVTKGKDKGGSCYNCSKFWSLSKGTFQRFGHVVSYTINGDCGHSLKWLSSPIVNGKFNVNCR